MVLKILNISATRSNKSCCNNEKNHNINPNDGDIAGLQNIDFNSTLMWPIARKDFTASEFSLTIEVSGISLHLLMQGKVSSALLIVFCSIKNTKWMKILVIIENMVFRSFHFDNSLQYSL
jgi:hypothetical protein